jgi:hypothetical protein
MNRFSKWKAFSLFEHCKSMTSTKHGASIYNEMRKKEVAERIYGTHGLHVLQSVL